jgi:hypothetical protein
MDIAFHSFSPPQATHLRAIILGQLNIIELKSNKLKDKAQKSKAQKSKMERNTAAINAVVFPIDKKTERLL